MREKNDYVWEGILYHKILFLSTIQKDNKKLWGEKQHEMTDLNKDDGSEFNEDGLKGPMKKTALEAEKNVYCISSQT